MRRRALRPVIQRRVIAQHAEHETIRTLLLLAISRRLGDGVGFQTPDEHSHARNVVELREMTRPNAADVHEVRNFFKRAAQIVKSIAVADINGTAAVEAQIIDVLSKAEQAVELDGACRPACDCIGQVFQNGYRAFAAPEAYGVRDVATGNKNSLPRQGPRPLHSSGLSNVEQRRVSHQIADVGDHPFLAGFHKPVFVELGNVGVHDIDLFGDYLQQGAQGIAAIGIA